MERLGFFPMISNEMPQKTEKYQDELFKYSIFTAVFDECPGRLPGVCDCA